MAGATSEPFDCTAGAKHWHMGWSQQKKDYCCALGRELVSVEHRGEHIAVGCEDHEPAKVIQVEQNETHSIPPWWVVAGVKPEGPETDYGRLASLSWLSKVEVRTELRASPSRSRNSPWPRSKP